jgi:hypothetical protein
MLAEALVLFSCVNNTGCTQASNLYLDQNPQIKQAIDFNAERIKSFIGPKVANNLGPILFVATGGTGVIKIIGPLSFQATKTSTGVHPKWGF